MTDNNRMTDAFSIAMERAREIKDGFGLVGFGVVELRDRRGLLIEAQPFANLITDAGDLYYATRGIAAVSPATPADATKVNGMKLGTGTTAAAKNGAGAALVTYLTASNVVFDATFPSTSNLGAGLGVQAVYKTTWAAGTATNTAITEAAIVNDQATNATTTAANSISRVVFTAVNKGASDTLAITWNHKFLGA
jgi:hypothetical protein